MTNGVNLSWKHIFGECHCKDDWWEQGNWWLTSSKTSLNVHTSREHFQDIWKSDCLSGLTSVTVHGSGCGLCVPSASSFFHNSKICCVWLGLWPFSSANIISRSNTSNQCGDSHSYQKSLGLITERSNNWHPHRITSGPWLILTFL